MPKSHYAYRPCNNAETLKTTSNQFALLFPLLTHTQRRAYIHQIRCDRGTHNQLSSSRCVPTRARSCIRVLCVCMRATHTDTRTTEVRAISFQFVPILILFIYLFNKLCGDAHTTHAKGTDHMYDALLLLFQIVCNYWAHTSFSLTRCSFLSRFVSLSRACELCLLYRINRIYAT